MGYLVCDSTATSAKCLYNCVSAAEHISSFVVPCRENHTGVLTTAVLGGVAVCNMSIQAPYLSEQELGGLCSETQVADLWALWDPALPLLTQVLQSHSLELKACSGSDE